MTDSPHDQSTLEAIVAPRAAGFALHWLHPKTKRPIGDGWQDAAVPDLETLLRTHRAGANLGVRLGQPSKLACGGCLHVFDLDIRVPDLADEAWDAFRKLFPGREPTEFPSVISGSGGESRHVYVVTEKPFFGKKLAVSEGKHRRFDKTKGRDVWSYDWEIELFGTGKQVAMPPSIHPDSGKPYVWERPFDFDMLDLGIVATIPAAQIEAVAAPSDEAFAYESREPLDFKPGQLEAELDTLPLSRIDDYHDWVMLGQALHHQFGGSDAGYELWLKHSKRSEKFDGKGLLKKWRGFGKNRRQPVTMATVRQWVQEARADALVDLFDDDDGSIDETDDEEDDDPFDFDDEDDNDSFADLLGGSDDADPFDAPTREEREQGTDIPWTSLFDINDEGAIKPTLHNVALILKNDPRLVGLAQLNEFTQETVQRTAPGQKPGRRKNAPKPTLQLGGRIWHVTDTLNGELWSDDRDFAIRQVVEAPKTQGGYGLKLTDRDLKAAVVLAANESPFHPVREYLESVTWDGAARVETMFHDYLGAEDNAYTRSVSRLLLVAAVTRIFEPGHKFDFAVIMEGLQGKRKSTFIETLGRSWFAELEGDFHDAKMMIELMQGAWIMEIPELSGFARADVRAIKAFISRKKDRARLAYARRAGAFPRQCIFIGSTNDREYLKDDTGGRRFWPMMCNAPEIDISRLEANVDQLWAEALTIYRSMRNAKPRGTLPLYLMDDEAREIAMRLQESRRVESSDDGLAGRIEAWLNKPVRNGGFDEEDGDGQPRSQTCLQEIWTEVFGGDARSYGQVQAQSLGRAMKLLSHSWQADGRISTFPSPYGRQRAYFRVG